MFVKVYGFASVDDSLCDVSALHARGITDRHAEVGVVDDASFVILLEGLDVAGVVLEVVGPEGES